MIFAQRLLVDVDSPLVERLGLRVPPLRVVDARQVADAGGGGRMIFAQRLLTDVERAPVERLGLRVLPLQVVERCQAVEADGGGRMIFAQRLLTDRSEERRVGKECRS